jgi:CxxC motif-containing protein
MKKSLICINCPRGCHLEISGENGNWDVSGNQCPRGIQYAIQEATDPRRMVTAAVPAIPGKNCAAVRTSAPLPVAMIPELLNTLYKMQLSEPAKRGDVLLENWKESGIDVIFSADFK